MSKHLNYFRNVLLKKQHGRDITDDIP